MTLNIGRSVNHSYDETIHANVSCAVFKKENPSLSSSSLIPSSNCSRCGNSSVNTSTIPYFRLLLADRTGNCGSEQELALIEGNLPLQTVGDFDLSKLD